MKLSVVLLLVFILNVKQYSQIGNIRIFQNSYFDVTSESNNFLESGILDFESDNINNADLYFQSNYNLSSKLSIGTELKFRGDAFNFDESNTILVARYNIINGNEKLSIGPYYEISEGNIGVFGAFRKEFQNSVEFIAKGALIYESEIFEDNYYILGAGLIYPIVENLYLIGEGNYNSKRTTGGVNNFIRSDYLMASMGLNYNIIHGFIIRGAMGYNIWNTSPELMFNGALAYSF